MSWEISITPEGWDTLRESLSIQPRSKLIAALLSDGLDQWRNEQGGAADESILAEYWAAHREALFAPLKDLPASVLAGHVFALIEGHMSCEPGGTEIWMDRAGEYQFSLSDAARANVLSDLDRIVADLVGKGDAGALARANMHQSLTNDSIFNSERPIIIGDGFHALETTYDASVNELSVALISDPNSAFSDDAPLLELNDPNLLDELNEHANQLMNECVQKEFLRNFQQGEERFQSESFSMEI